MTEKDTVSMATVQLKPDYAPSEVYSTASEPPPAYKRQANSVKIAKITAFTVIVSSIILGSFILASSYLQAKASCDQVQALDSVLEKELMLETIQQVSKDLPIPRAEALLGKENTDDDLQNLEGADEPTKKIEIKVQTATEDKDDSRKPSAHDNENAYGDSDESDEPQKFPGKVPLELDLSDLAAAILRNNKKSRMNCVVERKHAEEIVDTPSKTVALPFGVNLTTDPKKARITGERISIYCDGGDDSKEETSKRNNREEDDDTEEEVEAIRPMFIPFQRVPIPFGRMPQEYPLTHMPQRMMPPAIQQHQQLPQHQQMPMLRQLPPPFQQLPMPMRPPMPQQVMQAPRLESRMPEMPQPQQQTVRIHVQQIPFREIHVADDVPVQIQPDHREAPQFQIQRMPLGAALQRVGITSDDLRNIQRMAEERITDELRRLAAEEAAESAESNSNSEEDEQNNSESPVSKEHEQSMLSQGSLMQQQLPQRHMQPMQQPQQPQAATETQMPTQSQESAQQTMPQEDIPQQQQPQQQQMPVQRLILQPLPEQPRDTMTPPMPDQPQQLQYGRVAYGRSLLQPVRIPVPMMMQQHDSSAPAAQESAERPHFVQPRSV